MSRSKVGSSLDDFLKEEGIYEESQACAIKEVVAWQLAEAMKIQSLTKAPMTVLLEIEKWRRVVKVAGLT